MRSVRFILPAGVDDHARPSGGNVYDRHVADGLTALGWSVCEHACGGSWPRPDPTARAGVRDVLERIPDGAVVLIDGLVASAVPEVLEPHAGRLRLVVLVHMAFGDASADDPPNGARGRERRVLQAATAVVTTSAWLRRRLLELYDLPGDRVHVATPGVAAAEPAPGSDAGGALLCVAAVIPRKGHWELLQALATVADLPWHCLCVGTVDRDPAFVGALRRFSRAAGLDGRVQFGGPRTGVALDACYAAADVLVQPSRAETYGMVVTEALARGLPVVTTDVGGLPEALGGEVDGALPGLLVPPVDHVALAAALRSWLTDCELRARLRHAARRRRDALAGWDATTAAFTGILEAVAG